MIHQILGIFHIYSISREQLGDEEDTYGHEQIKEAAGPLAAASGKSAYHVAE